MLLFWRSIVSMLHFTDIWVNLPPSRPPSLGNLLIFEVGYWGGGRIFPFPTKASMPLSNEDLFDGPRFALLCKKKLIKYLDPLKEQTGEEINFDD